MGDLFLLSERQMARISPHFPLSHGVPRVDDRRVVSGIVYVIRNGLQWKDAPTGYGPPKTLYNRFIRWSRMGVFDRIFAGLAGEGPNRLAARAPKFRLPEGTHPSWPKFAPNAALPRSWPPMSALCPPKCFLSDGRGSDRRKDQSRLIRVPLAPLSSRLRWKLASWSSGHLPICAAKAVSAFASPASNLPKASR